MPKFCRLGFSALTREPSVKTSVRADLRSRTASPLMAGSDRPQDVQGSQPVTERGRTEPVIGLSSAEVEWTPPSLVSAPHA
jgi:hypothetical protein